MIIRKIKNDEFEAYWDLRLFALKESPESFGRSYEEEIIVPLEARIQRMKDRMSPENVLFVVEDDGNFVGMTGVVRLTTPKTKHISFIWGVYVMPSHRGLKLGRQLMEKAIAQAREWDGVKQLNLSVVSSNLPARRLYEKLGFVGWGTEPNALCVNDVYYDETHMTLLFN